MISSPWGRVAPAYAAYGLLARPGALPAAPAVARYWPVTVVTAQTALSFVLLLTPTGSLPSPRWSWWARMTAAAAVVLLVALTVASGPLDPRYQVLGGPFDFRGQGGVLLVVNQLALAVTTLAVVVGAGSLVVRFRRAGGGGAPAAALGGLGGRAGGGGEQLSSRGSVMAAPPQQEPLSGRASFARPRRRAGRSRPIATDHIAAPSGKFGEQFPK